MIQLSQFRLNYVAKPGAKVSASPFVPVDIFDLPINFCIHYTTDVVSHLGMRGSNPLIRNWIKDNSVALYHVDKIEDLKHRARTRPISKAALNKFYQNQSAFTKVTNLNRSLLRERQLLVMDYSAIASSLIINQSMQKFYYEHDNIASEIIRNISKVTHPRNNILHLRMPEVLLEKSVFNKIEENDFNSDDAVKWTSYDHLWLRELWLLIEGKGKLAKVVNETTLFACFSVAGTILTIDLRKLKEDGAESLNETRNHFYKLLEDLVHLSTPTDSEAIEEVEPIDINNVDSVDQAIIEVTKDRVRSGRMTVSEQERFIKIAQESENITLENGQTIKEFAVTKPEDYKIDDSLLTEVDEKIIPKDRVKSTIDGFHKSYVNNVMDKHIASVVTAFNNSGYILRDFSMDEHVDVSNHMRMLKITILPIEGKETTVELPVPVISDEGHFIEDGVEYISDIMRISAPIAKTAYNKVVLNSYYGKLFFTRSEMAKHDWSRWLIKNITAMSLDGSDSRVTNIKRSKTPRPKVVVPRAISSICENVTSFKSKDIQFYFDHTNLEEFFGKAVASMYGQRGLFPIGKRGDNVIFCDMNNILYENSMSLGPIHKVIGINSVPPTDVAIVRVFGNNIPVGIMLAQYLGFKALVKRTKAEVVEYLANTRDRKPAEEWIEIKFRDKRVYVNKSNRTAALIFSGLAEKNDLLSDYKLSDLEDPTNYPPIMINMGLTPLISQELDNMKNYFIDPITKEALDYMKEPTLWLPLLDRVIELLSTDEYLDDTSPKVSRLKGYERVPGMLYEAIVKAIRKHENSPSKASSRLDIDKYAIWKGLSEDPSTQLVQKINPVHKLKEQEFITLSGTGGKTARTITAKSRAFNEGDLGIISEATPDSSKVGIRTPATPNAKINSTLGFMGSYDPDTDNITSLISTVSNLQPGSLNDDGKRRLLSGVHASAIVPTKGSMPNPFTTGYDRVIGARAGKEYVLIAQQDGFVKKLGNNIIVEYKDGTTDGVKLGVRHGNVAGEYVSSNMVTDMYKDKKFSKGDVIAWNEGYFERDFFDSKNVVMKYGALSYVALCEGNDTLEDGSAISQDLANKMSTVKTKRKTVIVNFDQEITLLKDIGDDVKYDDVICRISNYVEGIDETDASISALERFSGSNPTSGKSGKVTSMELIYMGEKSNMSPKLKELADRFDKEKLKDLKELGGKRPSNCQVINSVFFGGEKVTENTLALSFYIDKDSPMGIGDKKVFGNQLKSIAGRVMTGTNETESGLPLGARFGIRSVFARIVGSGFIVGGWNRVIDWGCREYVRLARGG